MLLVALLPAFCSLLNATMTSVLKRELAKPVPAHTVDSKLLLTKQNQGYLNISVSGFLGIFLCVQFLDLSINTVNFSPVGVMHLQYQIINVFIFMLY